MIPRTKEWLLNLLKNNIKKKYNTIYIMEHPRKKHRDITSIKSFYESEQHQQHYKQEYHRLLTKYIRLRSLLLSLNHKMVDYFESEKNDERF